MNILFVTTKINFERAGGSVPDLDNKIRDMHALDASVRVLTVFSEHNQKDLRVPYAIEEERVTNKSLFPMQYRVFLFLRAHQKDADVVHLEGQFSYAAALYRLCGGKPVVLFYNREIQLWTWRGGGVAERMQRSIRTIFEKILLVLIVPFIDHAIFTTPQLAARYKAFGLHIPKSRYSIMPDFIDADVFQRHVYPPAKRDLIHIFASGRMIKEKGFDLLVDALALLPKRQRTAIAFTISGDGPERESLERYAGEKGVTDIVRFPGWVSKDTMHHMLCDSDIFVYPRFHKELSSVLLLEALAAHRPVIVPKDGGLEWLAGDAATTFTDNDAASLAKAIEKLVESSDMRETMSERAGKRASEFNHHSLATRLHAILHTAAKV